MPRGDSLSLIAMLLRPLMHRWERRLAAQDTERYTYTFDWGFDLLDLDPVVGETQHEALISWSNRVRSDPTRFYADPGSPSAVEQIGDRVRFASHVAMPEAETNRVSLRLFQPRRSTKRAMIVLPQWNADPESHVGLCNWLAGRGILAARLTLPYHEDRSPAGSTRADLAVSANIGRTLRATQQAVSDVRRTRAWLEAEGYPRVGVIGSSLGSCISFLALSQDPRLRVGVFHHVSSYFGDVVWRGISTRHVRNELERHCSWAQVRRFFAPISPVHFVPFVARSTRVLLLSGRYDLTFPFDLSRDFHRAFRRHGVKHRVIVTPWGHYTSGIFPFNAITVGRVLRYLDRFL